MVDGLPIMPPYPAMERSLGRPFVDAMFGACNLSAKATSPIEEVTIFEKVIIPEPAFQLGRAAYTCADQLHRRIAARVVGKTSDFDGKKIYLSRSRLLEKLRHVQCEDQVESEFVKLGFEVAYPEIMSFEDQVRMFNRARTIAGFVGSAFHTGMFSLSSFTGTLVAICGDEIPNSRLVLQNALKNYRAIFVRGCTTMPRNADNVSLVQPDIALLRQGLASLGEGVL